MSFSTLSSINSVIARQGGPVAPSGPPTNGLVFYCPFDTDYNDTINGLVNTNNGCSLSTSSKLGTKCLSFGSNKNIRIGSYINWGNVNANNYNFSGSFWLNLTSSSNAGNYGSAKYFITISGYIVFIISVYFTGSTYKFTQSLIGGGTPESGQFPSNGLAINTWQHVVFTFNNQVLKFYVNGTEVYSYSPGGAAFTNVYARASNNSNWGSGLNLYSWINNGEPNISGESMNYTGLLDSYRVYNRALTQAEVTALYNET